MKMPPAFPPSFLPVFVTANFNLFLLFWSTQDSCSLISIRFSILFRSALLIHWSISVCMCSCATFSPSSFSELVWNNCISSGGFMTIPRSLLSSLLFLVAKTRLYSVLSLLLLSILLCLCVKFSSPIAVLPSPKLCTSSSSFSFCPDIPLFCLSLRSTIMYIVLTLIHFSCF